MMASLISASLAVVGLDTNSIDIQWFSTLLAGAVLLTFIFRNTFGGKLHLPGPWLALPLLGDAVELGVTSDLSRFMFGRFKRYGSVFRLNLLGHTAFVVADEAALRPVLSDDGAVALIPFQAFTTLMGDYGTQSKKEIHGPWRKLMLNAVGGRGMRALLPGVAEVMQRHLDAWAAAGRVDLFEAAHSMGLDLATDVISNVQLKKVDTKWFKDQMRLFTAGMWGLPLRLPGSDYSAALAAKERLIEALMPEMEEAHAGMAARWEACGRSGPALAAALAAGERPVTILEGMMVAYFIGGHTTLRDMPMTIMNAVVASGDTTRFSLFTVWTLLAMSPRVQEQLFEEQKKVVAEHGPELSLRALAACPLLEATFKEAMRLLPTGGGAVRHLTRDLNVAGKVVIPAGEYIWYHPHLMHCLDPVLWDGNTDCDVPPHMDWRNNFEAAFRPERWLSEDTKPKYFFTFGSGTHLCTGMNLVMMEVKLLLALVVRKYRMELEVPDMLKRCVRIFPFAQPARGTGGMRLLPREEPVAA